MGLVLVVVVMVVVVAVGLLLLAVLEVKVPQFLHRHLLLHCCHHHLSFWHFLHLELTCH